MKRAIAEKIVPADLLLDVEAPKKQETIVDYLTTDEISRIAQSDLNPKVKRVFLFSCFCGMRYSDIKNLTWGNITDDFKLQISCKREQNSNLFEVMPSVAENHASKNTLPNSRKTA